MKLKEIAVPVSTLRGIGPATAAVFREMGIFTVGDLLSWWPRDWDDRTQENPINGWKTGPVNTAVTIESHEWFGFGRMRTLKLIVSDAKGFRASLICFNRAFLEKTYPCGSKAQIFARMNIRYGELQSSSFDITPLEEANQSVLPVYRLSAGITQVQMRKAIKKAREAYARGLVWDLNEEIRTQAGIPDLPETLRMMHEPVRVDEAHAARRAFVFEEFYLYEYALGKRTLERRGRLPGNSNNFESYLQADRPAGTVTQADTSPKKYPYHPAQVLLADRLPFKLTNDQWAAVSDINADINGTHSMSRLLQGDVGSGKTLVAFMAAAAVCADGGQCALMAPTELLARQHADTAATLLEPLGIRIAFLTGNLRSAGRTKLLDELSNGQLDMVIGTHALFSQGVHYKNLKLVIIDEQHRFGVKQRAAIIAKGAESTSTDPHLLMMSATPIPQSLALSLYGDLDVSVIRTMPAGRLPVITHLTMMGKEEKTWDFLRKEFAAGHQAYIVYPLIEDSDELTLKSAERMYEELQNSIFPGISVALLHSRIPEEQQRSIMHSFKTGSTTLLVATSVVEVGVDVPNATCMVIEHAERFGLAALHQLRGRIGRGKSQSWCFLIYDEKLTDDAKARLKVLHRTTDGFVIAEEDLHIRGPGELTGIRQSGFDAFTIADPVRDSAVLLEARTAAFKELVALYKCDTVSD